jgi:hypothetical protein
MPVSRLAHLLYHSANACLLCTWLLLPDSNQIKKTNAEYPFYLRFLKVSVEIGKNALWEKNELFRSLMFCL